MLLKTGALAIFLLCSLQMICGQEFENRLEKKKIVRKIRKNSLVHLPPLPQEVRTILPNTTTTTIPAKPDEAKRLLSLFTVVSFQNDACTSTTKINGTCFSKSDCDRLGGTASGSCASGFGVCCLVTATCGGSTSVNGTYFTSLGYPSTFDSVGSCQLTVNKYRDNVCQLRLNIENMILAGPETRDNKCSSDQFIVTGGNPVPAICGTNSGTHMYVDMGVASNSPVVLTVVTAGNSFSRSFSIKITQIECNSLSKASAGCLQYFEGVQGRVFSFNYNDQNGLMLSDMDYTICVRMERNFCGIQYSACPDAVVPATPLPGQQQNPTTIASNSFSITGSGTQNRDGTRVGTACATDWVTIPCATNTIDPNAQTGQPTVCVDRICGMSFNSVTSPPNSPNVPIYSFSKPFNIYVHTDGAEGSSNPSDATNRGFCLNFIQQPCTSSTG